MLGSILSNPYFSALFRLWHSFFSIELKQAMPEDRIDPQPQDGKNVERKENTENVNDERFESDTQKIVRRHLENKDDIITDEDIASVRVGMSPPQFDRATKARLEDEEAREDVEEDLLKGTEDMKNDKNLDEDQITPWDTIDPTK
jgi:hypothetical protein